LFKSLTDEWISPRTFSKTLRERAFFMELLNLLSLWSNSKRTLNYDKLRKVEKVTQYILDHYAKKITLQDLADTIQLSRSYLQVIFKEVTGTSPIEYLINVRVNKAKELIKAGCDNIREVSELCGFNDSFYFSRMFKKIEGVSPSQYRDIVRSQNRFV
jgi:YesN/AraC family two-component response regulator